MKRSTRGLPFNIDTVTLNPIYWKEIHYNARNQDMDQNKSKAIIDVFHTIVSQKRTLFWVRTAYIYLYFLTLYGYSSLCGNNLLY